MINNYDAIVVGTGISGGWAAKELCEKGLKTLVLERGPMVKHIEDYPGLLDTLDRITNGRFEYVEVDGLTEGAACTALLAEHHIDNDGRCVTAHRTVVFRVFMELAAHDHVGPTRLKNIHGSLLEVYVADVDLVAQDIGPLCHLNA